MKKSLLYLLFLCLIGEEFASGNHDDEEIRFQPSVSSIEMEGEGGEIVKKVDFFRMFT
jgi:hypothetical protein